MLPDAEYVLITHLRSTLGTSAVVDTRYPGRPPAVVVERIGGTASYLGAVDYPRLDVTAWAATKAAAHDLAAAARQATHAINGQVVAGTACGHVAEVMGLRFVVDESTETPRYLFTVEITMH